MVSELETLHTLLQTKEEGSWFGQWVDLCEVGFEIEGFRTVALVQGDDHRWYRPITVITRSPSGKFFSWVYQSGLTENQESEYHGEAPIEVEPRTRPVVVTDWLPVSS